MDFEPTTENKMMTATLKRYFQDKYPLHERNKIAYQMPFHNPNRWQELGQLGIFAALVSEIDGGLGGKGCDISLIFENFGRVLCCEPVLPLLIASKILSASGHEQSGLLAGTIKYAVAYSEPDAPYLLEDISTTASSSNKLNGHKTLVYGGHIADRIIVAANFEDSLNLYEIETTEAQLIPYGLIDGGGGADLVLENTPSRLLIRSATTTLQDALNAGILALCAESIGLMQSSFDITLNYLKERKQFNQPIGSFQALQHRMVDLFSQIEQVRSIIIKAAAELSGKDATYYTSMAKYLVGKSARLVAEESIQLHGGIAMTWEHPISHYSKRLIMLDHQLGDTDHHLNKVMERGRIA